LRIRPTLVRVNERYGDLSTTTIRK